MTAAAMRMGMPPALQPPARERSLIEILALADAWKFILESALLLAVILFVQQRYGGAPAGMPHPFWIPVLLMAAQYGIMGGLFAALSASAALFMGGLPAQSASQDFYDYAAEIAAQPCAWFASALILGGLRTLHMHQHAALAGRLDRALAIGGDIADRLEHMLAENALLERRIATDRATLGAVLRALAGLTGEDRAALAQGFATVIAEATGATSFTLAIGGADGTGTRIAIEDGVAVATAGPPPAHRPGEAELPIRMPIRGPGAEPAGMVICTRLAPGQDVAAARARLAEICAVLAAILALAAAPQGDGR
jgi:hypothetical protein